MSLFSPYILSLILKSFILIDLVQLLSFSRHSSHFFFTRALIMSFHDPFNVYVYRSNQFDIVPSKNSRKQIKPFYNYSKPNTNTSYLIFP
jgi:hypothetical protein